MTYSFCFSLPYGFIVFVGGIIGFLTKGSKMSLMMGSITGGLTMLFGYIALQNYHKGKSDSLMIILGSIVSIALSIVMSKRYMDTNKIMPAGFMAVLSIIMSIFYVYRLAFPLRKKKQK
mmetsp:Transcript_67908/g.83252  ORF Transcript_67908/g.83252 Transcript_67908/m.83252 type:complete len:119 (+) Transcript_67908:70-426(+)